VSGQETRVSAAARLNAAHAARLDAEGVARRPVADLVAVAGLVVISGVIEFSLRTLLTRPLYSDEAWRAFDIAMGPRFLSHFSESGAPLALGWLAIEDTSRFLFGDTEAALRAPMFLAMPVLGIVTYLLARRWLGVVVSFCVAALLLVNSWTVNNALQLKSYSYEGIFAVAAIALVLLVRRTTWRPFQLLLIYTALGLTAVFSLPNLFILGPLLLFDLARTIRLRDRTLVRIVGEALAAVIALAHYVLFVRPQAGVASTGFWRYHYAPHGLDPLVRFTVKGIQSFDPLMVTGVINAANTPAVNTLPVAARDVLALGILLLLAAGVWAAVRDAAARTLVVALGGALVLELVASAVKRWPFGMVRVNIFMLPLFYIVGGIGAVWLARVIRGRRHAGDARPGRLAWWRVVVLGAFAVVLAATVAAGGVATGHALAQTYRAQDQPTEFTGVKAAVQQARELAGPGDLAIIRSSQDPAFWYGEGWLYYMHSYQGNPPSTARLPTVAAADTISVLFVTPAAVGRFLAAHPHSPAIFLLELNLPGGAFPPALHEESLRTLRRFGYCPAREFAYAVTGHMTVLDRGACRR
jgi:hypothetical protein